MGFLSGFLNSNLDDLADGLYDGLSPENKAIVDAISLIIWADEHLEDNELATGAMALNTLTGHSQTALEALLRRSVEHINEDRAAVLHGLDEKTKGKPEVRENALILALAVCYNTDVIAGREVSLRVSERHIAEKIAEYLGLKDRFDEINARALEFVGQPS